MEHSFDTDIAKKYGVLEAVMLKHIYYWTTKNRANNMNYHDGYYWTYNSASGFSEIFPYLTLRQVRYILNKLENLGLIKTGNYNKLKLDKTKWYTVTKKGELEFTKSEHESNKSSSPCDKNVTPIPYINTDINTDIKPNKKEINKEKIDEFISSCWSAYPRKLGKGKIKSSSWVKLMDDVGEEQMMRCIERYKDSVAGKEDKFIMHGSTFFHGGYVDFLDENVGYDDDNVEESIWQT